MKKKRAKSLYLDGNSITNIATALGVTRTTIYNYKSADLKNGIDWDELRYLKQTNASSTDESEKKFLATLIINFENAMLSLNDHEPKERLAILTKFASAYYKLKQPSKGDTKGAKASGANEAIYALSKLAMEQNNEPVINFLSEYHDIIIERVLSAVKS